MKSGEFNFSPRVLATYTRPGQATIYAAGDSVSDSQSAAAVLPVVFECPRQFGELYGARCVVTPASGNLVITAFAFDLLLFQPLTNIPFADGSYIVDNGALAVSAAAMKELVGVFSFAANAWRNPAGGVTAGAAGHQAVAPAGRTRYGFNLEKCATRRLLGLIQVQAAWDPGNVAQQFDFALDVRSD